MLPNESFDKYHGDMSNVDEFRKHCLNQATSLRSFADSWGAWHPEILNILGNNPTEQEIFRLGDSLGQIFRSNQVLGRSNSAVSTGGAAWECLVLWYLNMIFWGTDVVVIRPNRDLLPPVIADAITVSISNHNTNTESDLIAFNVPNSGNLSNYNLEQIDLLISQNLLDVDLTVIQCKTNWNDNAQIPMLWDLIYSAKQFRVPQISVGINGVSPSSFRRFAYSFVTVPTVQTPFRPSSMSVLRVKNLTGGNYWGRPTLNGVAKSVSEFATVNYPTHFLGSVSNSIQRNLMNNTKDLDMFLNLSF